MEQSGLVMRFLILLCLVLAACGPKEIGEGTSEAPANPPEALGVDTLRAPMTGMSNTEKMLYWQNQPAVMENTQRWRQEQFRRYMGLNPNPENPAYREMPKQKSPFRQ